MNIVLKVLMGTMVILGVFWALSLMPMMFIVGMSSELPLPVWALTLYFGVPFLVIAYFCGDEVCK